VIFASNQSHTSLRERPRRGVGDEAIGGEDPLVIIAISLVSMMTSQSDACVVTFGELNSERYSSVHSKRRSRVCREQRLRKIKIYNDEAGDFLWLTVAGISAVQNTGHRVLPMVVWIVIVPVHSGLLFPNFRVKFYYTKKRLQVLLCMYI